MMRTTAALDEALKGSYVAVMRDATVSTFGAICGGTPEFLGTSDDGIGPCETVGIITIVGRVCATVTLGFAPGTASALAQAFAGFEVAADSPDMGDVIGELANILAGDAVGRLDARGIRADMSLPTVARGRELDVRRPGALWRTTMRFSLPQGDMWLGLAMGSPGRA